MELDFCKQRHPLPVQEGHGDRFQIPLKFNHTEHVRFKAKGKQRVNKSKAKNFRVLASNITVAAPEKID